MRRRAGTAAQVRGFLIRVINIADRRSLKALLAGKCWQVSGVPPLLQHLLMIES